MPVPERLSPWIKEIFFEENRSVGRLPSRLVGSLFKGAAILPQLAVFAFANFGARYPRSDRALSPVPASPGLQELAFLRWPSSRRGTTRGLPCSDSSASHVRLGTALSYVDDLAFAIKELHRVLMPSGTAVISLDTVPGDPTVRTAVTSDTLRFCSTSATAAQRDRAAELGLAGLFEFSENPDGTFTLTALKAAESAQHVRRIDIGCGSSPKDGYAGIDMFPLPGVSLVRDVDSHGLPFSDDTITHVYTAHFLEHVEDLVFVMNEIQRVCCHDALVEISVPALLGPYAAADPTHRRLFNARSFSYFESGTPDYAGIDKRFEILELQAGISVRARLRVVKAAP